MYFYDIQNNKNIDLIIISMEEINIKATKTFESPYNTICHYYGRNYLYHSRENYIRYCNIYNQNLREEYLITMNHQFICVFLDLKNTFKLH